MRIRRSHRKSQRGCVTCKSRHVKCDEAGPPCGRCKIRGTACQYANYSSSRQGLTPVRVRTDPVRNPEKCGDLVFPADKRLLELQLMHRWSTTTYKSCCTPGSGDDEVWQFMVPESALQYDFLLNGVFALAAFESARSLKGKSSYEKYVDAAIEYHGRALSSFQSRLPDVLRDGHEAAFCFSLMLMVLALASVQAPSSNGHGGNIVQSAITHFELVRGCVPVAESKEGYLAENPYINKMPRFEDLPRATLGAPIEEVLTKLGELNDRRITSNIHEPDEKRVQQVAYWETCKKALGLLRECFEKCGDKMSQGYALGWLNMAGNEYIKVIEEGDRIALLILMYWGVLVDKLAHRVWWAEHYGEMLVNDISDRLSDSYMDAVAKDVILLAQEQIRKANSTKRDGEF